ncbi:hypothetical protein MCUN1_001154 [Malassezia cuniculi]|uniref:Ribonuclease H2 subunit B wHTH domain-containing protein n=1 Tax=Malassezia cuniculi TaxID=948313 RepID=A0AAF0EQ66_9BASI|nr:hypothetical protein MCUN1_001154 [Malassezia cuniculi]
MALSRITRYAIDAMMVSTVLSGIKHTSGLSLDLTRVDEPTIRRILEKYLEAGDFCFETALSMAQGSSYFRLATPELSLFGDTHRHVQDSIKDSIKDSAGVPAYFGVHEDGQLYEVLVVRDGTRSWLVGGDAQVIADGAVRLLSPVDPAFVWLGLINTEQSSYLSAEDLLEAVAERHAASLSGSWPDILQLERFAVHLARICDTQHVDGRDMYRPSREKARSLIDGKVASLCAKIDSAPDTLGVQVRRLEDAGEKTEAAREKVCRDLVMSYISRSTAEWLEI